MMWKEHSKENKLTCRKERVDLRDFFVVEILEQIKMPSCQLGRNSQQ